MDLGVGESDAAVDADREVVGVGDHHQGLGAEVGEPEPADLVDQGAGQAAPARVRVGLDGLEPGQTRRRPEQSHRRQEPAVLEGSPVLPVAGVGQGPVLPGAARAELQAVGRGLAGHGQLDLLLPVGVGLERPVARLAVGSSRLVHGCGRHHRGHVDVETEADERRRVVRRAAGAVDAEGAVGGHRVRRLEDAQPPTGIRSVGRGSGQEHEVAPVEGRVVRSGHHDVVAAVLEHAAGDLQQREVGAPAQATDVHGPRGY